MSLAIRDLKTYFYTERGTVRAVDGIDLDIEKGEALGLVGESGCGKSTVALSILRLVPDPPGKIVQGKIMFNGEDLLEKDSDEMRKIRGAKISMIFQDPMTSLDPVFTVGFQVAEAIWEHQEIESSKVYRKVEEIFRKVRIPDAPRTIHQYPHEFSGGMRQRVMIAMALSCQPELLIADEPTTNLDVTIQTQVLRLINDLRKEFGSSILLITHDLGVIAEMSDKVAVMYAGKIVEYGDVVTMFKKPKHPYMRALLSSIPRVDVRSRRLGVIRGVVPSLIEVPSGCRFHPRCEYANKACSRQVPEPTEIEPGHVVSCLRLDEIA